MSTIKSKYSLTLDDILQRVRDIESVEKSADVARSLGVSGSQVSNWEKRGTIPFEKLFWYTIDKEIHFEWLMTGKGSQKKTEKNEWERKFEAINEFGKVLEEWEGSRPAPNKADPLFVLISETNMKEEQIRKLLELLAMARSNSFWD